MLEVLGHMATVLLAVHTDLQMRYLLDKPLQAIPVRAFVAQLVYVT